MRAGKIILIIFASILACVIAVIGLFAYFLFHVETKVSYDLERWDELEQLDTYDLPSSSEIGDFEKTACKYYYQRQYIFVSEAYTFAGPALPRNNAIIMMTAVITARLLFAIFFM